MVNWQALGRLAETEVSHNITIISGFSIACCESNRTFKHGNVLPTPKAHIPCAIRFRLGHGASLSPFPQNAWKQCTQFVWVGGISLIVGKFSQSIHYFWHINVLMLIRTKKLTYFAITMKWLHYFMFIPLFALCLGSWSVNLDAGMPEQEVRFGLWFGCFIVHLLGLWVSSTESS